MTLPSSLRRLKEDSCRLPEVCVLVRVKNEARALPEFLKRIEIQDGFENVELVFLDSGSTDQTLPIVCKSSGSVYQIAPEDFSFGSSCNHLMEISRAPIGVFLSGHVLLQRRDSLKTICSVLQKNQAEAAYLRQVPNVTFGSNSYERAYLARRFPAGDTGVVMSHPAAFSNAASALTRIAWERVPFPELPASEDHAWALRHLSLGGRIHYLPQITAEHSHSESAEAVYRRVRINVESRGIQGNRWKAGKMFAGIFASMMLHGALPWEAALYARSHARAYL